MILGADVLGERLKFVRFPLELVDRLHVRRHLGPYLAIVLAHHTVGPVHLGREQEVFLITKLRREEELLALAEGGSQLALVLCLDVALPRTQGEALIRDRPISH